VVGSNVVLCYDKTNNSLTFALLVMVFQIQMKIWSVLLNK